MVGITQPTELSVVDTSAENEVVRKLTEKYQSLSNDRLALRMAAVDRIAEALAKSGVSRDDLILAFGIVPQKSNNGVGNG